MNVNPIIKQILGLFDQLSNDELLHISDLVEEELEARANNIDKNSEDETSNERTYLPRIRQLVDWGVVNIGDQLSVRGYDDDAAKAKLVSRSKVEFKGEEMSCYAWAKEITGWKSIRVYDWVIVERNGKLLGEIRKEAMLERGMNYPD